MQKKGRSCDEDKMNKNSKIAFLVLNILVISTAKVLSGIATAPVANSTTTPVAAAGAAAAVAATAPAQALTPIVTDIPSTFTFRASCIKKTYVDSFYQRQLNEPALVSEADGQYTLYATCLNGLGVPIDTKIKLKIIIRNMGEIRTISIRSIVDASNKLRNCADICNRNGILECVPPPKKK
jgi:hypothetical protein